MRSYPYNTQLIDITINLKVTEQSNRRAQENLEQYTRAERLSESDHPKIKARADRLHADSHKETAKRALDWVAEYLEHGGFVQEDRGALYALENRTADCTEYMYLYGALLRANKIPTRFVSGFIVESNKKLEVADYHNWVEVYLDNTWRVVDPLNKTFLEAEDSYITMRIIDHSVAGFFDNAQQLIKSDSEVKIMMK